MTAGNANDNPSRRHVRNGTAIVLVALLVVIIVATALQLIQAP